MRTIDIDLLMILAALGAAFVGEPFEGAMLLFLFSFSNTLQDFALDRTRNAIRALMKLRPTQAEIYRGGQLVTLPIDQVRIGDRMRVRPGDRIALDGTVIDGSGSVDQSSLTGESVPVFKERGDPTFAGTINQDGSLEISVTKLAKDSTIARLIQMVEEAQSQKAETQRFIDQFEQYYAMGVIVLTALVAAIPPLVLGHDFNAAFYTAMTVMVAASPCAIVISTPATVLSAIDRVQAGDERASESSRDSALNHALILLRARVVLTRASQSRDGPRSRLEVRISTMSPLCSS